MSDADDLVFADDADDLLFAGEEDESAAPAQTWKVLIADDEEEVHRITRMVLSDFRFEGQGLEFLSAHSAAQTLAVLREHPDTAIVLLDVVMESDDAGLAAARRIREELGNRLVRIILRTGQPGQAPEERVIADYDINDYKEKTELTAKKLFTTTMASLRAYRDLCTIEKNRRGLEKIIGASADLFELQSLRQFTEGVLTQLTAILGFDESSLYVQTSGFAVTQHNDHLCILAGTGEFEQAVNTPVEQSVPAAVCQRLHEARERRESLFLDDAYVGYFLTKSGSENILYLGSKRPFSELERDLVRIFSANVAIAFDNIHLNQEIVDTQKEVIFTLGDVVETRSKETVRHVQRVSEYAYLLAREAGLSEDDADLLRLAAPMHDVGKIGIPDAVLNKPGRLTPEEFELMKTHTSIGHDILKGSKRPIFRAAATIAWQHHEHWDGKGYPQGLAGTAIQRPSRIVGLVDVFDALSHRRVYKAPWTEEAVLAYIEQERGKFFDPELVDLFLAHKDAIIAIRDAHPEREA